MKKVLAVILLLTIAFGVIGCSNLKEITKDDIVDKIYTYEKDGCGSNFTITVKADGTFNYYEGALSSHIGMGEWSYSDGILTLFEKTSRFVTANEIEEVINSYSFLVEKDTLIFVDKGLDNGSGNFRYVKVKDGEKFFGSIYYPSMVMFNDILYTGTYYSGDKEDLSVVGKIESCIDYGVPSKNNQANDPLVGCEIYTTSSAPDFIFVLNNGIYSSYKSTDGSDTESACDNVQLSDNDNQETQNNDLSQSVTGLEFWIAENVDDVDFSKYQIKYGMMGGTEYYGTGYVPTVDEYGQQVDPEHCVIYTVTSYPDYANREQHITHIYITDPKIEFYGITLNSSFEDFEYYIQNQGFEITHSNENSRTAEKGKFSITITKEWIRIRVEVENKDGIIF